MMFLTCFWKNNKIVEEIYKICAEENPYFMRSIFAKKYLMYNLGTLNLLNLPKINKKVSVFTILLFLFLCQSLMESTSRPYKKGNIGKSF